MKKVNCLILSLSILLLASYSAAFCEIPKQVYEESVKAHRFWYGLRESNVSQDEKAQLSVETLVSSPWQPYELYIVGAENLKGGFGILGMQERVKMLNGNIEICTKSGKGFNITIEIPG